MEAIPTSGMAFLRTESGVVEFVSKINLIFEGNSGGKGRNVEYYLLGE
jgi:hypothetical protein